MTSRPAVAVSDGVGLVCSDIVVELAGARGIVQPVRSVSLEVKPGEKVALVGETGSGKTMFLRSLLRLIPPGLIAKIEGSARLGSTELVGIGEAELRRVRGRRVGIVFQDPMTYLNPTMQVGRQVAEAVRGRTGRTRTDRVGELFESVRLPAERAFQKRYPHELSGGQRQRVMMAISLAGDPELLLADEPTTALDVTVQAGILRTLHRVVTERRMGLLLVTHDLGVVAEVCERVYVMKSGEIVESGPVQRIFDAPEHPYTQRLMSGVLTIDDPSLFESRRASSVGAEGPMEE